MKKKGIALLCTAVMALGILAGCNASDQDSNTKENKKAEQNGTFTMAINYMPSSLQPNSASDDQVILTRPIYEPLFVDTKDGLEYYLAEKLDVSEDRKTYTIHVNKDASWSDGVPVTADDILFTIQYNSLSSYGKSSYNTVDGKDVSFEKVDDKTLKVILPEVYGTYTTALERMAILPSHSFDNDPGKVDDSGYFNNTDMVTSGAYTVSEINDDSIVFDRREDYYRGTPQVKKIVMKTIGSGSTKQVAFENGEISYMRITTKEELEKYEAEPDKYNIYTIPEARLNYLQINPFGPMKDKLNEDGRKAVFLALDIDEIVDAAYGDKKLGVPANSLLTPEQTLYDPDCKGYKQDIKKAKELAKSSGLEGQTLTYIYNADRPNMEAVATVIQQQLEEAGIHLKIEGLDSPTFFNRFFGVAFNTGEETSWDLGSNGWDSERGSTLSQSYKYINDQPEQWGFSDEAGQLAVKVNTAVSFDEAKEAAKELQELALSEYYEFPLTYTNYVMVSQKNVEGLDLNSVVPEFIDFLTIQVK